jgi:catechol 2,3-dioxygenase-like lactoylglutathione lyase family enzyme
MGVSLRFYRDVLGMKLLYGGPDAYLYSLRTSETEFPILNLEQGGIANRWGRMIFHVADVDAFWTYLKEKGFDPDSPRTPPGESGTSTCTIPMGMSCPLLGRYKMGIDPARR